MIILLGGCQYKVPDSKGCLQLAGGGAFCRTLVSEKESRISRSRWARQRIGTVCYEPKEVEGIISFIEQVCNDTQRCINDVDERIDRARGAVRGN